MRQSHSMWIELHAGVLIGLTASTVLLGALVATWRARARSPRASTSIRPELDNPASPFDAVTGLPSRAAFEERLSAALAVAESPVRPGCLLYAGIDGFRLVNDRHGHQFGDRALAQVGRRLRQLVGDDVPICRLAGDEFAIWLAAPFETVEPLIGRLLTTFGEPLTVDGRALSLGMSVGVAQYPEHGPLSRMVARAAAAMRSAKLAGGKGHAVFNPQVDAAEHEELSLARELLRAIEQGQLELYYQPKIDATTLQVTAAEALLRWRHPTRGMVMPDEFIPLAERHGHIAALGGWVLDEALRQAAAWRKSGLRMRVAVNVSGYQMRLEDFASRLQHGLRSHGLHAERFTCEITESVAMEDTNVTRRAFERLRELGVHVSIDDFGTGHSSLASLRKLPAEELKIDRAFVIDLEESADARAIVSAIVQMAHTLGLRVVAEGVETEGQRDLLVAAGCDELQGFLFAKPMSARALGLWAMDASTTLSQSFKPSLFADTQTVGLRSLLSPSNQP